MDDLDREELDLPDVAQALVELQEMQRELSYLRTENMTLSLQRGDLTKRLKKAEKEITAHKRGLAKDLEIIALRQRVYDLEVSKTDLRYDEVNRVGLRYGYALKVVGHALVLVHQERDVHTFEQGSASMAQVLSGIRADRGRLRGAMP